MKELYLLSKKKKQLYFAKKRKDEFSYLKIFIILEKTRVVSIKMRVSDTAWEKSFTGSKKIDSVTQTVYRTWPSYILRNEKILSKETNNLVLEK